MVFNYLQDKNTFEGFYRKLLSSRVGVGSHIPVSEAAESLIIAKLKIAKDPIYTEKLEYMYKDVNISRQLNKEFKSWLIGKQGNIGSLGFTFETKIFHAHFWNLPPTGDITLPSEVSCSKLLIRNNYTS